MEEEICPKCLGSGEILTRRKDRICRLCEGSRSVTKELAEDFVSSMFPDLNEY